MEKKTNKKLEEINISLNETQEKTEKQTGEANSSRFED